MSEETPFLDVYEPVYELIKRVPAGSVVTYGQVAGGVNGVRVTARQVGTAVRYAPEDVPWHRVVGSGGWLRIASRSPELAKRQRSLLAKEGVYFLSSTAMRVDMKRSQATAEMLGIS